jgi:hypothetical protein
MGALGLVHAGAHRLLELCGEVDALVDGNGSLRAQMERPRPPVRTLKSPFEHPLQLESVNEGHHRACRDMQSLGDRLLRLPLVSLHGPQDGELAGLEPERADKLCEPS